MGKIETGPEARLGGWGNLQLKDATWNEKLAAIILVAGILAIGIAPGWLNDLLRPAADEIMNRIGGK